MSIHPPAVQVGVGLKPQHYRDILAGAPAVDFFEVHAENYMGDGGPPHRYLGAIRERFALSVHGVGMSIGADAPLDAAHLQRLIRVLDRYEPMLFSEHLAWSTHANAFMNDLLPVPYTRRTLDLVTRHIDELQHATRRKLLLENPSTYVVFAESTYAEADFIAEVARRTGCGLLLDLNNLHVSATNHGWDALSYLAAFPLAAVEQIHLAGHAVEADDAGRPLLIDTHDRPVDLAVWGLLDHVVRRIGPVPVLIEWDGRVPAWPELEAEARRAAAVTTRAAAAGEVPAAAAHRPPQAPRAAQDVPVDAGRPALPLSQAQGAFGRALLDPALPAPPGLAAAQGGPVDRRFNVYRNNVVRGLMGTLEDAYPVTRRLVGDAFFAALAREHALRHPPRWPMMNDYGEGFAAFIDGYAPAAVLPYLGDVARLERLWVEAHHAAEAASAALDELLGLDTARLGTARFALHPSLRVLRSRFPAATIWHAHGGAGEPPPIALDAGGEDALVLRAHAEVHVHVLPPGAAAMVEALAGGRSLEAAACAGADAYPLFDPMQALFGLFAVGGVARVWLPAVPAGRAVDRKVVPA